ncbi:MAG: hypothetical protein KME28_02705 [Pelatocladus maniniholoensis HA4357-MV3]|uniref:Transmembrane protein n=1 Tax=Pelatocladus maniniholoensis HA4357-MV3 TaxID=1117104 RepID=A0A9E3H481_9NOST|nr:hypothetical protein [Pelatocladus maniniholoensis HA4357-MV3]
MENTQNVQQPLEAKAPINEAVKTGSELQTSKNSLIHLLVQHPWLVFAGVLLALISTVAVALYSLGYVGRVGREEPEFIRLEAELPIATTPQTTKASYSPVSLQMIAAIAISCAGGCFIVFLLLNRLTQEKVQQNPNWVQSRLKQRHQKWLEPSPSNNLPVFVPPAPQSSHTSSEAAKPVVTVLPPEADFNDDSKDSLASMMDLRKQTSLSSLLRE